MGAVVILALLAVAIGVSLLVRSLSVASPITGSGTIQAIESDVGSKVPGRLIQLLASDGQSVHRGEALARLDPIDQQHNLAQAQANLEAARARVPQAGETQQLQASTVAAQLAAAQAAANGAAASREVAVAAVAAAQANVAASQATARDDSKNYERAEELYRQGFISTQALDAARTAADMAQAQLAATMAQRNAAQKQLDVAESNLRQAQAALAAANANLASVSIAGYTISLNAAVERQVAAALATARTQLEETIVRSPFDGIVVSHSAEAGDLLAADAPVMSVMQANSLYLRVYIAETDLARVAVGQHVDVSVDGVPNRTFNGIVAEIDNQAQYTPSNVQTKDQRAELVFGVKVDLYDNSGTLKPGLPADATFAPR
jgi:HlyD family secretion protein